MCVVVCVPGCVFTGVVCAGVCVRTRVHEHPMTLNGAEILSKAFPQTIIILLISLADRLR